MSRIVPAKIKVEEQFFEEIVLEIEENLSDDFVLFQSALPNALLCGGVGAKWTAIVPVKEFSGYDSDADEISCGAGQVVDPVATKKQISGVLEEVGVGDLIICYWVSGAAEEVKGIHTVSSASDLKALLDKNVSEHTAEDINAVLKRISPGASAYVPGTITQSQAKWRQKKMAETHEDGFEPEEAKVEEEKITSPRILVLPEAKISLNKTSSQRVKHVEDLVRACIVNIQRNVDIFASGIKIDPDFLARADSMLPVILVAASERWTPVVAKAQGKGGFDIRLARDPDALVGMRVIDVLASSPLLLFMPIANVFKSTRSGGEYDTDKLVGTFRTWVEKYNLEDMPLDEIEVRVALNSLADD